MDLQAPMRRVFYYWPLVLLLMGSCKHTVDGPSRSSKNIVKNEKKRGRYRSNSASRSSKAKRLIRSLKKAFRLYQKERGLGVAQSTLEQICDESAETMLRLSEERLSELLTTDLKQVSILTRAQIKNLGATGIRLGSNDPRRTSVIHRSPAMGVNLLLLPLLDANTGNLGTSTPFFQKRELRAPTPVIRTLQHRSKEVIKEIANEKYQVFRSQQEPAVKLLKRLSDIESRWNQKDAGGSTNTGEKTD